MTMARRSIDPNPRQYTETLYTKGVRKEKEGDGHLAAGNVAAALSAYWNSRAAFTESRDERAYLAHLAVAKKLTELETASGQKA
jgi:uncharacterized membrane protein YebE (DUF533 family)